jgi:transposase
MWEPYVQATRAHVPDAAAKIVFDRYHIMTHMGRAVDDVRKREHRALAATGDTTLTGSKYLWLYAEEKLPEQQRARFAQLKALTLAPGRSRRACASSGTTPARAGLSATGSGGTSGRPTRA